MPRHNRRLQRASADSPTLAIASVHNGVVVGQQPNRGIAANGETAEFAEIVVLKQSREFSSSFSRDLSGNRLTAFQANVLENAENLEELDLRGNALRRLSFESFPSFYKSLQTLYLLPGTSFL